MEKLKVMIADNNPVLLKQLTDIINSNNQTKSNEIGNKGDEACQIIITNPYDIDSVAGRIERICTFLNGRDVSPGYSYNINTVISKHLNEIGIPPSLKGYRYISTAVKEVLKDETVLEGITKILYPNVAKIHNSTSQRVEKAIRHAIEVAWARNSESKLKEEFKYATSSGRTRPTNSEFIATLSQYIKMSQNLTA